MADEVLKRDENRVTVLAGVTDDANLEIRMLRVDPVTKRLLISATISGLGLTIGTSTITSGTDKGILYNNAGVLGEYTPSASLILGTDANKNVVGLATSTYPSLTELSYVKGLSSAIQTQLNDKAPLADPTFTGTVTTPAIKITGGTPGIGKVLTSDADGDATWGDRCYQYGAKAYRNTSVQVIPTGTATVVQLNAEVWDLASEFDTSTYKYTVATTGYYLITFSVLWQAANDGAYYQVSVRKNGTGAPVIQSNLVPGGANDLTCPGSTIAYLTASDYLELVVYQTTGGNESIVNGEYATNMAIQRIC